MTTTHSFKNIVFTQGSIGNQNPRSFFAFLSFLYTPKR
jgi:hypothetical protein